jgi:DNA-binding response OmpR family regulator
LVVPHCWECGESLQLLLGLAGYRVEIARGAAAALERAREEPPAAAVIDLHLLGPDGYEVARLLREALGAGVRLILLLHGEGGV